MKKCFQILISILITLGALSPPKVMATSCFDYQAVFVRGSGESLFAKNYQSFKTHLTQTFATAHLSKTLAFYDLGTTSQSGHRYPAIAMDNPIQSLLASISGGTAFSYGESINEGVLELKAYINNVAKSCPATKFILAGYSQGAQVLTLAQSVIPAEKIAYLATFGDPKLYLPEGASYDGERPLACLSSKKLSPYRINVPDCTVLEGMLGGVNPYQTSAYAGKLGTWCNLHDFMCGSTFDFDHPIAAHTSYSDDGSYRHASQVIVSTIQETLSTASSSTDRDAAILIDTTGSMSEHIERYKTHAKNLARSIIANGGRVALYEYRDLADPYSPQKLCDLGCSFDEFQSKLDNITVDGGGDIPESTISAGLTILNDLSWARGATKTLLILTDAPAHDPDRDGATKAQLIRRAWEIDPVHISVITDTSDPSIVSSYQDIVTQTGGRLYGLSDTDMELSTTDSLSIAPESLTIPYLYDEFLRPTLSLKSATKGPTSLHLSLEKSPDTAAVFVTVGEAILGLTTLDDIELTDLSADTSIALIPIAHSGTRGTPLKLQFSPSHFTPKAPNTGAPLP